MSSGNGAVRATTRLHRPVAAPAFGARGVGGRFSIGVMIRTTRLLALLLLVSCRREPSTTPAEPTPHDHGTPHVHAKETPASSTTPPPATGVVTRPSAEDALWTRLGAQVDDGNRTVIGRYEAVRITAEGEPFITADAPAFDDAEVIEAQGDRIRVVTRGLAGWSQIALWIDEADAAQQLSRPATLLPDPKHTTRPEDGTIELAPGERVDILERTATHAKVRTRDEAFSGWVEIDKLSAVFVDTPFELPRFDAESKPGTPVARTPGGKPFFTMPELPEGTHMVRVLSSPKRGWLQVEFVEPCRRGVRVRGWVRKASTVITGEQAIGFGCGMGHGVTKGEWGDLAKAPSMTVPKDTELRTTDGVLFGRTRGDVELRRGADDTWRLLTRWGAVPVVTKPPT